jgi:DNA-binding NarL/FixJ family response regulator
MTQKPVTEDIAVVIGHSDAQLAARWRAGFEEAFPPILCSSVDLGEAAGAVKKSLPDVALLEAYENGTRNCFSIAAEIARAAPRTRMLLVCEACNNHLLLGMIRSGMCGYLLTSSEPALRERAVRAVQRGEDWYGRSALLEALLSQVGPSATFQSQEIRLTPREQEILLLADKGMSNKHIGKYLAISDFTVKTHLHRIYSKLHLSGRGEVRQAHLLHTLHRDASAT